MAEYPFYSILPNEPANQSMWVYFNPGEHPEAFTIEECDKLIELAKTKESHYGQVADAVEKIPEIRSVSVHDIGVTDDSMLYIEKIIKAVRGANDHWWNFDLTHLTNIEVLKYTPGEHYVQHLDWGPGFQTRKLSAIVLLSEIDQFEGGELEFMYGKDNVKPKMEKGTIIVFPSWLMHRVNPIVSGERWAATAWVQGPPFK